MLPYPTLRNYIVLNVSTYLKKITPKHASKVTHITQNKREGIRNMQTLVDGSFTFIGAIGLPPK